jgi:hypothetical protein
MLKEINSLNKFQLHNDILVHPEENLYTNIFILDIFILT